MKVIVVLAIFIALAASEHAAPVSDDDYVSIYGPPINLLPQYPVDDEPSSINIPGGPTINIVVNVDSAAQHEEIEPTPVNFVDDEAEADSPVNVVDAFEPSPVIVVDDVEARAQPTYEEDFVPDPDVYY